MSEDNAPDVAAIAGRLSEAQQRALIGATAWKSIIFLGEDQQFGEMKPRGCSSAEIEEMQNIGLFDAPIRIGDRHCTIEYRINWHSLGLALRNHLMEKNDVQG